MHSKCLSFNYSLAVQIKTTEKVMFGSVTNKGPVTCEVVCLVNLT